MRKLFSFLKKKPPQEDTKVVEVKEEFKTTSEAIKDGSLRASAISMGSSFLFDEAEFKTVEKSAPGKMSKQMTKLYSRHQKKIDEMKRLDLDKGDIVNPLGSFDQTLETDAKLLELFSSDTNEVVLEEKKRVEEKKLA